MTWDGFFSESSKVSFLSGRTLAGGGKGQLEWEVSEKKHLFPSTKERSQSSLYVCPMWRPWGSTDHIIHLATSAQRKACRGVYHKVQDPSVAVSSPNN